MRAFKDYAVLALAIFAGWYALQTFFPSQPELPDQAPSMVLDDPHGDPHDLAELRGRPVVLNFWATWCPPCVEEIPGFTAFAAQHPDVAVVGVALESGTAAEVRQAAERLKIGYTVLLGDRQTKRLWDISTLPTTVFIGPDGRVLGSHVGGMSQAKLEAELEAALAAGDAS
jgi:thiol-disulfide isomerase/thioredoxin